MKIAWRVIDIGILDKDDLGKQRWKIVFSKTKRIIGCFRRKVWRKTPEEILYHKVSEGLSLRRNFLCFYKKNPFQIVVIVVACLLEVKNDY